MIQLKLGKIAAQIWSWNLENVSIISKDNGSDSKLEAHLHGDQDGLLLQRYLHLSMKKSQDIQLVVHF